MWREREREKEIDNKRKRENGIETTEDTRAPAATDLKHQTFINGTPKP